MSKSVFVVRLPLRPALFSIEEPPKHRHHAIAVNVRSILKERVFGLGGDAERIPANLKWNKNDRHIEKCKRIRTRAGRG